MTITTKSEGEPFLVHRGPDYFEYQLPISVKAVIAWRGLIPLLRNERNEWELPGGKLDVGEDPSQCLHREILEELGWDAKIHDPFFAWVYAIRPDRHVFVLTYLATYEGESPPRYSNEHKDLVLVRPTDVDDLPMPAEYKESIRMAASNGHLTVNR